MASEKEIEKAVCEYARSKGCYVRKFASPNHRGVPDRLFITPRGVVFFIEFKAPGKKPTDLQQRELETILKYGIIAEFIDNADAGRRRVDQVLSIDEETFGYEV